jgi:hypothetical protein
MFSYYGSKSNIVKLYPKPKFPSIVEPFAGSGKYSLRYFDNDVLLIDKYEVIINIWKWLQKCSPSDILKLPRPKVKQTLNDFTFDCIEAKHLMGFIIHFATFAPGIKVSPHYTIERPKGIDFSIRRIANSPIQN